MPIVTQERRLPILGHPDWLASSDGHIYRTTGERVHEYRKELGENRLRVSCNLHDHGYHTVARLVWETFFGSLPPSFAVVHRNGDVTDNRPVNLSIEQSAGSYSNRSRKNPLTSEQKGEVHREVHRQLDEGIPKTRIAKSLGISPRGVRHHATDCSCNPR